jgi:pilus assembly protein Flp/PilA
MRDFHLVIPSWAKILGTNMQRFRATSFIVARQATRFARDENGATAIEYAMIAGGIATAIVAAVSTLGTTVKGMYESVILPALE